MYCPILFHLSPNSFYLIVAQTNPPHALAPQARKVACCMVLWRTALLIKWPFVPDTDHRTFHTIYKRTSRFFHLGRNPTKHSWITSYQAICSRYSGGTSFMTNSHWEAASTSTTWSAETLAFQLFRTWKFSFSHSKKPHYSPIRAIFRDLYTRGRGRDFG